MRREEQMGAAAEWLLPNVQALSAKPGTTAA
jgi:hypothetical protein